MKNESESNNTHYSEEAISIIVSQFFRDSGYIVRREVPNLGQSADIAATKNRWLTIIEVKRNDWSTALKQCKAHELVADYICIVIALKKIPQSLKDLIVSTGYGLIHFREEQGTCDWEIKPKLNKNIWPPQRKMLFKHMREIGHDN